MTQREKDNWQKVKEALERAGKTDTFFYKRAVAIVTTGRDPMESW
jgi:hypothetical protein